MAYRKAPHHRGDHDRLSRAARRAWNADPTTRCAHCGLTLAEGIQCYGPERARWEADHRVPGRIARSVADYQPAHATCNRSHGAAHGNRLREPHSERW